MKKALFISIFAISPVWSVAEDRITLDKDTIIGNEEAPKALYIVPWRPLQATEIGGLEIQSLLGEELEPLKPEVFRRQVELFQIETNASKRNTN